MASSAVWLGVLVVLGGTAAAIATAAFRRQPALPPAAETEAGETQAAETRAAETGTAEARPAETGTAETEAREPAAPEESVPIEEASEETVPLEDAAEGYAAPAEAGEEPAPVAYDFAYEILGDREPPAAAVGPLERLVLELNRLYADPPPDATSLLATERSQLLTETARRVLRTGSISTGRAGDGTVVWAARLDGGPDDSAPAAGEFRDCLFAMPGTLFTETLTAAFLGAPTDEESGTVTLAKVTFEPKRFVVRTATVALSAVRDADQIGPLTAALGVPAGNLLDAIVSLSLGTSPARSPRADEPEPG